MFVAALLLARAAGAQGGYYNLDAGRPTRVEDAVPTERNAMDVQLAPLRFERLDAGTMRWRMEPKLSVGALPLTELEVRAPFVYTRAARGGASSFTSSGVGIGALHALTMEAGRMPGLAIAAEVMLPAGSNASSTTTYSLRALATRSTVVGRLHLNGTMGTYTLPTPRTSRATGPRCPDGSIPTPAGVCEGLPVIPDPPCLRMAKLAQRAARDSDIAVPDRVVAELVLPGAGAINTGSRWMIGLGSDHAFPLQSLLLTADVFVEQFSGPYSATEWTAEGGARHQWTPRLVIDAGMSRRFSGLAPSFAITLGLTYAFALREVER